MSRQLFLPILLVALSAPVTADAAVVVTSRQDGETRTQVYDQGVYYDIESEHLVNRFDVRAGRCLMVNHETRAYVEGDCDAAIEGLTDGLKVEMERQLARLSPQERAQMEAMLAAVTAGSPLAKVTSRCEDSDEVAGYAAERCLILIDGSPYSSVWVSLAVAGMIGKEFDLDAYRRWDRRMREAVAAVTGQRDARSPAADPLTETFDAILAKGYPLRIAPGPGADLLGMSVPATVSDEAATDTRVISVEQTARFEPARYALSPDYTRATSWADFLRLDFASEGHEDHAHD